MSKFDNSGPAFPGFKCIWRYGYKTSETEPVSGMGLRDYFAAKAMQAFLTRIEMSGAERAADAYKVADAMLKARQS